MQEPFAASKTTLESYSSCLGVMGGSDGGGPGRFSVAADRLGLEGRVLGEEFGEEPEGILEMGGERLQGFPGR